MWISHKNLSPESRLETSGTNPPEIIEFWTLFGPTFAFLYPTCKTNQRSDFQQNYLSSKITRPQHPPGTSARYIRELNDSGFPIRTAYKIWQTQTEGSHHLQSRTRYSSFLKYSQRGLSSPEFSKKALPEIWDSSPPLAGLT